VNRLRATHWFGGWLIVGAAIVVTAWPSAFVGADDALSAVEYGRQTIYHSPQKPGFTSWVGAWTMPDGDLMVSFTQATGPTGGRPAVPKDVRQKLNWPPAGAPGYDMTGLDLKNVHLRSPDGGKTWKRVSADTFESCMNGVTGEAETALPDGTVVRGVWGFYLPYAKDLPRTGYLQRSTDGTKTWGKPEVLLDPKKYSAWPRRIRVLRDGRLIALLGVAHVPAGSHTRAKFGKQVEPMLIVSSDKGKTWKGPVSAVPKEQRAGWTEEFDAAETANGDLLCVFRREGDAKRWQGLLEKAGDTWVARKATVSALPHSGQPELLATREGPILHVATTGVHWTADGKTWQPLKVPGSAYYPRAVQTKDGRIFFFGHVGGDDPYGKVDQSVVMSSFRLRQLVPVANRKSLSADEVACERIALGGPDDYKPCIAQLPGGELLLTAFHQHKKDKGKVLEQTLLFRSKDGGKSWSELRKLDLPGREPYLTVLRDGTIFLTSHLLANDVRNEHGYTHGYLHRSTDSGKTWESTRIESEGVKPKASNHSTRNVLQLDDGTLLLGVDYDGGDGPYLMWRSRDNGKTWDNGGKCRPKDFASKYGFFGGETWLWQAKSGKIWALARVDSNEFPIKGRPIKSGNDQSDHFILFSSADRGKTFDRIRDFGDYGEMYMSILRLQDKRLLLTFTVRDLAPSLGVRAIPGVETKDGFEFDFGKDRVMLDTRTPIGKYQGGGFGPTVQMKDGTLVTSYSYRGKDDKTHLEVVRWKLPGNR
jgi:BNR repeat-like domain